MHGNIPCVFDCWADPVVHLLLLKSSISLFPVHVQKFHKYLRVAFAYKDNGHGGEVKQFDALLTAEEWI